MSATLESANWAGFIRDGPARTAACKGVAQTIPPICDYVVFKIKTHYNLGGNEAALSNIPEVTGSSNSLQEENKSNIYSESSIDHINTIIVMSSETIKIGLSIDKLTLVMDLPPDLIGGLAGYLYGILGDKDMMHSLGLSRAVGTKARDYKINIYGRVPICGGSTWSEKSGFLLQACPKDVDRPPMRLDINPLCLNPKGLAHLRATMKCLNIEWPWIQHARVTRVDVPFDVWGCTPEQFVWDVLKRPTRRLYLNGGRLETLYIGSTHSDQVAIYDKGLERGLGPDVRWTRIEARILRPGRLVQDLPDFDCPLGKLLVWDPEKMKGIFPPLRSALTTTRQAKGLKGMLAAFGAHLPNTFRQSLEVTTPQWWKPEEIWNYWPFVLQKLLPDLLNVEAKDAALMASYKMLHVPKG